MPPKSDQQDAPPTTRTSRRSTFTHVSTEKSVALGPTEVTKKEEFEDLIYLFKWKLANLLPCVPVQDTSETKTLESGHKVTTTTQVWIPSMTEDALKKATLREVYNKVCKSPNVKLLPRFRVITTKLKMALHLKIGGTSKAVVDDNQISKLIMIHKEVYKQLSRVEKNDWTLLVALYAATDAGEALGNIAGDSSSDRISNSRSNTSSLVSVGEEGEESPGSDVTVRLPRESEDSYAFTDLGSKHGKPLPILSSGSTWTDKTGSSTASSARAARRREREEEAVKQKAIESSTKHNRSTMKATQTKGESIPSTRLSDYKGTNTSKDNTFKLAAARAEIMRHGSKLDQPDSRIHSQPQSSKSSDSRITSSSKSTATRGPRYKTPDTESMIWTDVGEPWKEKRVVTTEEVGPGGEVIEVEKEVITTHQLTKQRRKKAQEHGLQEESSGDELLEHVVTDRPPEISPDGEYFIMRRSEKVNRKLPSRYYQFRTSHDDSSHQAKPSSRNDKLNEDEGARIANLRRQGLQQERLKNASQASSNSIASNRSHASTDSDTEIDEADLESVWNAADEGMSEIDWMRLAVDPGAKKPRKK